jgi:fido (protein-threonine AMPylation protein)
MDPAEVPRTREQVSALEARYRPFEPATTWSRVGCDTDRWRRHAGALREAVHRADPQAWDDIRAGFLRAAALDSSALAKLIRPVPDLTTVVLRSSMSEAGWSKVVDAAGVVVECHRRALVVAADAAEARRPLDENLIARLQDLIVESQQTYTVTVDGSDRQEVELPRRQYKPVSNFLLRTDQELVPFAPAGLVAPEMARLTAEFNSEAFANLHPVVQSAYSHVALIRIHPFADGNGRLARTLACIPVLREVGLPQLILSDQWPAYVQALLRSDAGDPQGVVQLFLAAQISSMDLARRLLETAADAGGADPVLPRMDSPERTLLDLVALHLREAIGAPEPDRRVAVSRSGTDRDALRIVVADADGGVQIDVEFTVEPDEVSGWLRLVSSAGDALEVWQDDVQPAPLEIVHLRVRSWLDRTLLNGRRGLPDSARVRGLFVLGAPRSGTTMIGNWLGSHPGVLRLAEYGGSTRPF